MGHVMTLPSPFWSLGGLASAVRGASWVWYIIVCLLGLVDIDENLRLGFGAPVAGRFVGVLVREQSLWIIH